MGQGFDALTHQRAPFGHRLRDAGVISTCSSVDVLCVQEILSRDAQQFFDGLGPEPFVSRFRDDNRVRLGDGSVRGTGLGIGARSRLTKRLILNFPGERVGWDRLARKGALYVEVDLGGSRALDLVTVHLQAGYDPAAARVRASQLAYLRRLIDEIGSARERPFVVCGDFNVDGLESARRLPEYEVLSAALEGFVDLGAEEDLPTYHPHPEGNALAHAFEPNAREQRIDYIFVRPSTKTDVRCKSLTRILDRPLEETTFPDGRPGWASDHYGLAATLEVDVG